VEIVRRNHLNQADVLIRPPGGSERVLRLGAGATRAIETFADELRDQILAAAGDYAQRHPLARDGRIYDNHLAAVTGGGEDVPQWRRQRNLDEPAVPGPNSMPEGFDVFQTKAAVPAGEWSARLILERLIGQTIHTATGVPNTVLELTDGYVVVGTKRTPAGARVPIEWCSTA
jgi:hypothetical protein